MSLNIRMSNESFKIFIVSCLKFQNLKKNHFKYLKNEQNRSKKYALK